MIREQSRTKRVTMNRIRTNGRGTEVRDTPSTSFGTYTFHLDEMRRRLPRPIFEAIEATIRSGKSLDVGMADVLAGAMKDWAVEHGATHFTHWFQPLHGATAEKHDAFLNLSQGAAIEGFSGEQLIQAEPDASSFPSGGMRSTFEARGYTAWDPTSPAFLVFNEHGATLTIPSVFVSYTGEALDKKTPLLRSMRELSRAATHVLDLMGRPARRVVSTLGAEQEYFLVDRRFYDQRPDLQVTGRTVIGAPPAKGQQMEDNYFGAIDDVALDFMGEIEIEAWKLGIPAKTRHNEVAPHQYEVAPIHQATNVAVDHNQMLMELMRKVARRRGLAVLFHEKPFEAVNGSGKHNNWSMADDAGRNLLDPGTEPDTNVEFLFFLCAVLRAVHRRARLLRAGIASIGNDHRLGANEAPPAIISVFLGDRLTGILETLREGRTIEAVADQVIQTGVEVLPEVRKDNTDRNRTSPFAFTGNKFEFRAVGASQSNAMPMSYLNLAVAEALDEMAERLEKRLERSEDRNEALLAVVREAYDEARPIVFNGNNYDPAWVEEAEKRGLPNEPNTPAALRVLTEDDTKALFERLNIASGYELDARHTVRIEQYVTMLEIEAQQMLRMAESGVLPAAYAQQGAMAEALAATKAVGADAAAQEAACRAYAGLVAEALAAVADVREAADAANGDAARHAARLAETLIPAMERLRAACDALEVRTSQSLWPFPTYHQMLFM